ncbi:hypothetical protein Ahy_B06g084777 [Arachis hypogaea]|uniref:Ubiquitin-like protease family profile domain-containing protein n=1 Tax=Arachis hypogaea TaxID=3818 RepID=A0A444YSS1_ARAHY|nr:hypothetical protein Ahy_B06g084777 [Arachis hypogaea]
MKNLLHRGRRKLTCDKRKVTMSHLKHVNLESDDPSSQGHTYQSSVNKPAESMVYFKLSLVEDLASELAEENMMVVREETQFEALAIIPIQVCLPLSQTTTMPEIEETPETENEPTPVLQIEGTTKESTPTLPPAPSKINPATEDAAALMMMARIASYVPKIDPMPSFSLGFTDSSQEEAATQEGVSTQDGGRAKTPKTSKLLEQLWDLNMALGNHPQGIFLQPKNNKPFRVEDYPIFISFLDLKKLASHRYIFAPVCHSQHWWLWLADTRKRKFYIVDPYHTKSPSDERTALNTFVVSCYDCAIYVMKWIEIFQPANIKRKKYEWDNWTQDEVDHFRVEYASRILFHEMNQKKAEAIKGSNAIRLSKPSSLLLSPYCQIDSKDIDTD